MVAVLGYLPKLTTEHQRARKRRAFRECPVPPISYHQSVRWMNRNPSYLFHRFNEEEKKKKNS